MNHRNALIIGGGIGGLAAAIALQRAGYTVQVAERTPVLREVGAGITLWANAQKALVKLGLGRQLSAIATISEGAIRDSKGVILTSITKKDSQQWFGGPVIALHRAELHSMLLAAAGKEKVVRLGKRCTGVEQNDVHVRAHFENGDVMDADVLIGADGIQSVIRTTLFGNEPMRYSGYTAWRGVMTYSLDDLKGLWGEYWGRGTRLGLVPLSNNRAYWFVTKNTPPEKGSHSGGLDGELLTSIREYPHQIQNFILSTPSSAILRNDIYDRKPLRHWSAGRITLLGDAAHATTPNLGQGACQAIEDAVILGQVLADSTDVPSGLRTYERLRLSRANSVIRDSRRLGAVGQWESSIVVQIRNQLIKNLPKSMLLRQIAKYAAYEDFTWPT